MSIWWMCKCIKRWFNRKRNKVDSDSSRLERQRKHGLKSGSSWTRISTTKGLKATERNQGPAGLKGKETLWFKAWGGDFLQRKISTERCTFCHFLQSKLHSLLKQGKTRVWKFELKTVEQSWYWKLTAPNLHLNWAVKRGIKLARKELIQQQALFIKECVTKFPIGNEWVFGNGFIFMTNASGACIINAGCITQ